MLTSPHHTFATAVGVFKSLKSNFSRACQRYLSTHPGQVITTDILASLLCQAWAQSITPVNAMSGFRRCGIYPLNPGEISDCQLAPSKVFTRLPSDSNLLKSSFTVEQEKLYQKPFEEGYDMEDSDYSEWLRFNHPDHSSKPNRSVLECSCAPSLSTRAPDSTDSHFQSIPYQ